ncbi:MULTISPECIES: FMN reductase [unclassified Streptomyces]|uniref:FMN reductase n=1 Tax=Streptomyces johnsoniae TaxID=3075532 RepID=A0ABU2SFA6_9ACTN|nr:MULTISPECIES: FMN reductase [unclassified Streptomyces]MDT0446445.1 FMN reductase [Streptomyces sp. DSM 41886]ONK15992.1 FMN reductase (NADPH) [Streptomyces sp. MP131-18]
MTTHGLVVVTAGLGRPSATRLLADRLTEATGRHLAEAGREVEPTVIELRELATDIAGHLVTGFPAPALRRALDAVGNADGLIAVSPVFAASYSGLFKSFFDLLDPTVLTGKPVLIAATGGTPRHSLALEYALRPLFVYLHATVVPTGVFAAADDWGSGASAGTDTLPARIDRAAAQLAALLPAAARPAAPEERVVPFEQQLAALRPD